MQITPMTMICGTYRYSIHGIYKATNTTGGATLYSFDKKDVWKL